MKRFTLLCLLILFGDCFLQAQPDSLVVITYNIWNGFDWGKDQDRRARLANWMNAQSPDVVALQELCGYDSAQLAADASSWGHPYSILLKTKGYPVGLTSREPIHLREKLLADMHHGALLCRTFETDFVVVHFSPFSFQKRRSEADIILSRLRDIQEQSDRYIVLGDFNAHSPFDADLYDSNGPLISRLRISNADKPETGNLFQGNLDYAVMSKFLGFPLVDVVQARTQSLAERGSFPGLALVNTNQSELELQARIERIDYILASPSLAIQCYYARIHNSAATAYLSDHYPAVAKFARK